MKRKVAIALESSPCSVDALRWLIDNFLNDDDEVTLIHVLDLRPIILPDQDRQKMEGFGYASLKDLTKNLDELYKKKAREMIKEFQKICLRNGFDTEGVILQGKVKYALCDFALRENIDVVAVGSQGLGATSRILIGSVSDYCVHNMPCPVIVVKCMENKHEGTKIEKTEKKNILCA
eukprot:CAMPEP_0185264230 /NCGR_PEP_ID=MMETSP1359-20130426/21073_1 /TAXON_ID=552665 /ORGANISM="Bigelowiella longifila, Strain CCMP242" /LENGTH=176 /DNA_ID=CAMNT_0027852591 /DNA_START=35 /DNA_END=565 /DNA_ORIENTATION=+